MTVDLPVTLPHIAHLGENLRRSRENIIADFAARARPGDQPILRRRVPHVLERLGAALTAWSAPAFVDQPFDGDLLQVIHEYQVLRDVVIDHLGRTILLGTDQRQTVSRFFDAAVSGAVRSFNESESDLCEHLVRTVAPNLRSSLGVVRMAAELAMDEADDPVATRALLARVRAGALRTDRGIQDVLDLMVIRAGGRLSLDLNRWDMLGLVNTVAAERAETSGNRLEVRGEGVIGWWAHSALRRAFDNVFAFAIGQGPAGARTQVLVHCAAGRVLVSIRHGGAVEAAAFEDDPLPIDRTAVTELRLARGVVESHGGELRVTRGPTFTLCLPLDARPFQKSISE